MVPMRLQHLPASGLVPDGVNYCHCGGRVCWLDRGAALDEARAEAIIMAIAEEEGICWQSTIFYCIRRDEGLLRLVKLFLSGDTVAGPDIVQTKSERLPPILLRVFLPALEDAPVGCWDQ